MKKVLIVLITLLIILGGCTNKEVDEPSSIKQSELSSTPVDMSVYKDMNSTDHQFTLITPSEMLRAIDDKESALIYIGYTGCHVCQDAVSLINEAAKELDIKVYYMDCFNDLDPLMDKHDETIEVLKPMLRKDQDGNPAIYTPHLFAMVNGEFKAWEIGLDDYDNTNESRVKVIERYKDIMKYFS